MLKIRPQPAEHGRSKQDAGEQLTHDGGLTDAVNCLAEEAANQNQGEESCEERDFGGGLCVRGSTSAGCAQCHNGEADQVVTGTGWGAFLLLSRAWHHCRIQQVGAGFGLPKTKTAVRSTSLQSTVALTKLYVWSSGNLMFFSA